MTLMMFSFLAPCGVITFISKGYGGRITDSQLTIDCGVVEKVEPDDEVMLDKGFPQVNYLNNIHF